MRMEASTMFGRHLNIGTLRRAAMLGNEKMMLKNDIELWIHLVVWKT